MKEVVSAKLALPRGSETVQRASLGKSDEPRESGPDPRSGFCERALQVAAGGRWLESVSRLGFLLLKGA